MPFPLSAISYFFGSTDTRMDLLVEVMEANDRRRVFAFYTERKLGTISNQLGRQMIAFVNEANKRRLPLRDFSYFISGAAVNTQIRPQQTQPQTPQASPSQPQPEASTFRQIQPESEISPITTPQSQPQTPQASPSQPQPEASSTGARLNYQSRISKGKVIAGVILCVVAALTLAIVFAIPGSNLGSTCTITYDGNGGICEITDSTEYRSGDTVQIKYTPEPKRDGYQFLGWSTISFAITPDYQKGKDLTGIIRSNVKLYAVWSEEIKVIYIVDGDKTKVVDNHNYKIGDKAILKDYTGKKENYHFYGWKNSSLSSVHEPGYETTLWGTETYEAYWLPVCKYNYTLSNSVANGFDYQIDGYSYLYTETPKDGYKFVLATFTVTNVNVDKSISMNSSMLEAVLSNSTTVDKASASYSYSRYVSHDPDSPIQLNKGGSVTYHCIYEIPKDVQILKLIPDSLHDGGYYDGYWMELA